jgi:hypothetical protein
LVRNEDVFVDDVEVGLHIFVVAFPETFEQHNGYLFTSTEAVRTDDLDDLGSDAFVVLVDEFFDEIEVDEYDPFLFGKLNFILNVKFKQTFCGLQQHREIGVGIGAADLRPVEIYFERRFLIEEIVDKMLDEFLSHHVPTDDRRFLREFVPELKVLVEFGPALGDGCGDEAEEVVQELQDQLVVLIGVFFQQGKLLVVDVVGEGVGEEVGNVGSHLNLRILYQQGHEIGILGYDLSQSGRVLLDVLGEGIEQFLETGRLEPEAKGEFLAKFHHLLGVVLRQDEQFGEEVGETCGGQAFLEEMYLVVGLDLGQQRLGDVGLDLVGDQCDYVAVVVDLRLLFWGQVDVDVILALLFTDHLDLLHFYLQFLLFLFFGILDHFTALLLRLCGLFFELRLSLFGRFFLESQQLQHELFLFLRFDLQLSVVVLNLAVDEEVGAFAVLSLLPVVLILIGERSSETFSLNIGNVETIDQTVVELKPLPRLVLNVADIVTHLRIPDVTDDARELVLVVGMFLRQTAIVLLLSLVVVGGEGVKIEFSGKFVLVGNLLVYEGVQIEDHPLEMQGEYLRRLADPGLLGNVHLLLAEIAVVVVDDFPQDEALKGLRQRLRVLDFE